MQKQFGHLKSKEPLAVLPRVDTSEGRQDTVRIPIRVASEKAGAAAIRNKIGGRKDAASGGIASGLLIGSGFTAIIAGALSGGAGLAALSAIVAGGTAMLFGFVVALGKTIKG
ncbi:MAG: hypothetical protein M1559_01350 [Candidatus Marsarchaeota archaeon]|nr:hypothetical protein [Candidatus Marsarchaeota archaeon]